MTPTPPSTTPSSNSAGGHSPDAQGNPQFRVVRKRNRVPLSCAPCRHRKLKCNRSNPCENCVRRGDAASCSYAPSGSRKKNQSQGSGNPNDMQDRINRLEGLVLSLMTNGAQSAGPVAAAAAVSRSQSASAGSSYFHDHDNEQEDNDMIKEQGEEDSDVDDVVSSLGILKVDADKGKALYVGDSHWHLVLSEIAEVKNFFVTHKKEMDRNYEKIRQAQNPGATDGPAFLFNTHGAASDVEIRSEVPAKSAVDKLVTRYFNSCDFTLHIIHSPTFHKELDAYWQDPSNTSIVWMGLLYSILCLAMQSYSRIGDEPPEWKGQTRALASEYKQKTVECLVSSDYTKSSMYTIETLVMYVFAEYNTAYDAEVGIWVIIGMLVRLAMRMGYHRDPRQWSHVSPFQGEMRRRVWAFIRQLDILFSFQLALPSMIRINDCDTLQPRNLFEDDLKPDMKELPAERPKSEPTHVSYAIAKSDITLAFGLILEDINGVHKHASYDEVLKRDNYLRELKENLAPHLRLRPLEETLHDPATLLMQRYGLDILWQKCMCVLHRKYIAKARLNPRYSHSRRACVDASMAILRSQALLHRESQPGGRMRSMKWFIPSLTKHDYLLAAMIVCLDLHYDGLAEASAEKPPNYDQYFWSPEQHTEMMQALEVSRQIWIESAETSMEGYKASKALGIMLDKLRCFPRTPQAPHSPQAPQAPSAAHAVPAGFTHFDENKPEHSAAMTLGMLSGGLSPNSAAMFNSLNQLPNGQRFIQPDYSMESANTGFTPNYDPANPFGSVNTPTSFTGFGNAGSGPGMTDMPASLDWDAWDAFLQGNTLDPDFNYPQTLESISPVEQQQDGSFDFGGVFMGANGGNTPGR